jgi:hypothetical protein
MRNWLLGFCVFAFLCSSAWADGCPTACADCTLPNGQVGQFYKLTLYANIGKFSKITGVTGNLPPGVSVNIDQNVTGWDSHPHNLVLVGTPSQPGTYVFNYKFENGIVWEPIEYIPGYGNYITQKIQIDCIQGTGISSLPRSVIYVPIPIDDDIYVIVPVEQNLPRDPGVAGDATVTGIDSNGDGVRDDVERGIVYAYPKNPKAQTVLFEMAKYYQAVLANSTSAAAVQQYFGIVAAWGACLDAAAVEPEVEGRLLRPLVLNSYDRSYNYILALRSLQGAGPIPEMMAACP